MVTYLKVAGKVVAVLRSVCGNCIESRGKRNADVRRHTVANSWGGDGQSAVRMTSMRR